MTAGAHKNKKRIPEIQQVCNTDALVLCKAGITALKVGPVEKKIILGIYEQALNEIPRLSNSFAPLRGFLYPAVQQRIFRVVGLIAPLKALPLQNQIFSPWASISNELQIHKSTNSI